MKNRTMRFDLSPPSGLNPPNAKFSRSDNGSPDINKRQLLVQQIVLMSLKTSMVEVSIPVTSAKSKIMYFGNGLDGVNGRASLSICSSNMLMTYSSMEEALPKKR
mmetsp:Transcript_17970/g.27210  ORF Transcript_17970/g.27210 Transcript_17970/m.27210 type:complete len:105 (-) Transcript_17970:1980-2294(-)